jgi:hypothetical protein
MFAVRWAWAALTNTDLSRPTAKVAWAAVKTWACADKAVIYVFFFLFTFPISLKILTRELSASSVAGVQVAEPRPPVFESCAARGFRVLSAFIRGESHLSNNGQLKEGLFPL